MALVALTADDASLLMSKLKNISQLRTEHQVYELPDWHPLIVQFDKREPDDPCSYLLAIWTPASRRQDFIRKILIPCRTAIRGSFPLNGTYFQVNEVFADHASSLNPIDVPREWVYQRRQFNSASGEGTYVYVDLIERQDIRSL